ncbi:MAG: tetratricopeptide repeat protein [Spirochaetaceae bacterium]|nr:MAG: tetratricopeptide repeat protein [Spirochaetaceae bacterium]
MIRRIRERMRQRRALTAYAAGDFERAGALFRAMLKAHPETRGIRHNLALTCIALEQYEEAEEMLLTELDWYGEYYPRLRVLADLYYVTGRREAAHEFYRRTLASEVPDHDRLVIEKRVELTASEQSFALVAEAHAAFSRGNSLMANEDWAAAVREFEHAASLDVTNIHALNNAGTVYLNNLDQPDRAVELFRQALRWSKLPWIGRNLKQAVAACSQT